MKRLLWLGLSVICIVGLAAAGAPGGRHPVEFTLAPTGGDPGAILFTLAPRLTEARGSGVMSAAYLEDGTNTAIGAGALLFNTTGMHNSACGQAALYANTTGNNNAAVGSLALFSNTEGKNNTACGYGALYSNTTAGENTATGFMALYYNIDGSDNVANGKVALLSNIGGYANTAIGNNTLVQNTYGTFNTAIGINALNQNTTGGSNTAVGAQAGEYCKEGKYNIYVGALVSGTASDTNTIRIGLPYSGPGFAGQNKAFIAGIVQNPIAPELMPAVVGITSDGQLGKFPSELLPPKGDAGPQGPQGPQGPTGEGLVPGSLLFLVQGATPPATYVLLGSYDLLLTVSGSKKPTKLTVSVYQKPLSMP